MKLVASITNKIISRLGARVHALASGFGFYVFAGFLVVIALLATQAVAENELDLADSITFYLTLDQMQMAYYENDSDNLLVPLQKHDAFVQKQAETEQDAIRLVHYWIGVSRFYAILAARDEFATSLQNARDWAEKASTQKIKSLLEARVNLEAAETSLMLGLPAKSMDELERISAQILAADLQLKARVHSAKAGAYLVLLDGVAALRQSRLALELFAQLDASKSAVGLRAKIRYGAALNMVDAPDSENYLTKLSEEITDYDQPKTLLLAEFFSILGVAIYGEAQAAQSANIFEALVEKANFDASHPLVLSAKMGLMMADEAIGKNNSAVQRGVG
ncbi:MAG: hypothetical protein JKY99_01165, partial [Rhizobiales bacterium]|nr:hypothetical protein [Hyphomicrobiales bacterium]